MANEFLADPVPVSFSFQVGYKFERTDLVLSIHCLGTDVQLEPVRIPLDWFHLNGDKNEDGALESLKSFKHDLTYFLRNFLSQRLIADLPLHLADAVNLIAIESGLNDVSPRKVLNKLADHHREVAAQWFLNWIGLTSPIGKGRGRFSEWTPVTLTLAIKTAMSGLELRNRTYEKVNAALRERFPDKAPFSANALKSLVNRFGVNWKQLKNPPKPKGQDWPAFLLALHQKSPSTPSAS